MDKFDNNKPNVILFSDHTSQHFLMKSFGVYKVARGCIVNFDVILDKV